jgi:hypothetical protein
VFREVRLVLGVVLCGMAVGGVVACGDDTDAQRLTEERIAKERHEAARIARQEERVKQLEQQLRQQNAGSSPAPAPPTAPSTPSGSTAPAGTSSCSGGLYVNSVTTCPFAENVRSAYNRSGGGDATVEAYSAATGRTYLMTCSDDASLHVCYGGNNARIYFP